MKIKNYNSLVFVFLLFHFSSKSQFYNLPPDYFTALLTEEKLSQKDNSIHTGIKPYIHFYSDKYKHNIDSHNVYKYIKEDQGVDAVFYNHLINIDPKEENIHIRIDPIVNFEKGRDFSDSINRKPFTNTRGIIASGEIGKQVYFETMVVENQSVFMNYMNNSLLNSKIIPGQGRYKIFKQTGYDYAFASGFVSIQVSKQTNIQLGHGKQKIGHGYRSLLLSDNSFNYPYLRLTQQWFKNKIQYSAIYASLTNFAPAAKKQTYGVEPLLQKKAASFQYLSFNPHKSINLSFFNALIWQAGDHRNRQQIDWQFFNPILFSNLGYYGLNNKNKNMIIGTDLKLKLTNRINMYYQMMADDLSNTNPLGNGYGQQVGLNLFELFGIKHLLLQGEYNYVSERSYRNTDNTFTNQAYNHYNQNLAFVIGSGQELILLGNYKIKRWDLNFKYNYLDVPLNNKPYYTCNIINVRGGYTINTAYNLNLSLGYTYRSQNFTNFVSLNNQTSYFFIALKTSLYNFYYDF